MKPGPVVAMVALILVGFWLVLQPALDRPRGHMSIRIGAVDLKVEQRLSEGAAGAHEYRVVNRRGFEDRWLTAQEFDALLASEWDAWSQRPLILRTLLGFFNITNWTNFTWVAIGLGGQIAFFGRMLVQWVVSEKQRESVVPTAFWWLSLFGSLALFSYFVWRVDFVGVLGQSTGVVIYIRNLRLIHKQKRRAARAAGTAATSSAPTLKDDPAPEPSEE